MVVHGHRKHLFGAVLTDDMLVQRTADLHRLGHAQGVGLFAFLLAQFFVEDAFAHIDAAVADVDAGSRDEFAHLRVAFSAKTTHCEIRCAGHGVFSFRE